MPVTTGFILGFYNSAWTQFDLFYNIDRTLIWEHLQRTFVSPGNSVFMVIMVAGEPERPRQSRRYIHS